MTSGVPEGLVLRLIFFNIYISDIDSRVSEFAGDTKRLGTVNTPEEGDAIQRDLDRLEQRAQENLMRFSKSKSCTWVEATLTTNTSLEMKGLSAALLKKT